MNMSHEYAQFVDSRVPDIERQTAVGQESGRAFGSTGANGGTHIYLYLIKPRNMADQWIRPMAYNFTSRFKDRLSDLIYQTGSATAPNVSVCKQSFVAGGADDVQAAIMPTVDGAMRVNMVPYRSAWTFIMMVDTAVGSAVIGTVADMPKREIYSGWVVSGGEPAALNATGNWVFDPHAMLSITRVSKNSVISSGYRTRVINDSDVNVVTREQLGLIDTRAGAPHTEMPINTNLYKLTPDHIGSQAITQAYISSCGSNPSGIRASNVMCSTDSGVEIIHTSDKDYGYVLNNVVNSASETARAIAEESVHQDYQFISGDTVSCLGAMSSSMYSAPIIGSTTFDPKAAVSLREIMSKYDACLDIGVVDAPYNSPYEQGDPSANSPRNIAYAILSSAIPCGMSQACLAEISFAYDTTNTDVFGNIADPVVIRSASIHPGVSADNAAATFVDRMKISALHKIHAVFGHFRVVCSAQLAGSSIIDIYLYDYPDTYSADFLESNSLIDSLNTSMIGDYGALVSNAIQYGTLAGTVVDSAFKSVYGSEKCVLEDDTSDNVSNWSTYKSGNASVDNDFVLF